jgi:hypothetical protein
LLSACKQFTMSRSSDSKHCCSRNLQDSTTWSISRFRHCTSCSLGLLYVLIASLCFGSGQMLLQLLHIEVLLLLLSADAAAV